MYFLGCIKEMQKFKDRTIGYFKAIFFLISTVNVYTYFRFKMFFFKGSVFKWYQNITWTNFEKTSNPVSTMKVGEYSLRAYLPYEFLSDAYKENKMKNSSGCIESPL